MAGTAAVESSTMCGRNCCCYIKLHVISGMVGTTTVLLQVRSTATVELSKMCGSYCRCYLELLLVRCVAGIAAAILNYT
jgi:hypothetical protein